MKISYHYILLLMFGTLVFACSPDNFDEPKSQLYGRLHFQEDSIYLEHGSVSYELYQDGFGKTGPISSFFTSSGEFSHLLFNGTYKMVVPNGQGPFLWDDSDNDKADTVFINVEGNTTLDIEVTPFWIINEPAFSYSSGGVNATFGLEQIVMDSRAREVERVTLFLSKTVFANTRTNVKTQEISGGDIADYNNITLSAEVPELVPTQNYIFASLGVKFVGIDDLLFSPTRKIQLN